MFEEMKERCEIESLFSENYIFPDRKIATTSHKPKMAAMTYPSIPKIDMPNTKGPLSENTIIDEPIISEAIIKLKASRLLDLSNSVIK